MKMKVTAPYTKDVHLSALTGYSVYIPAGESREVPTYVAHMAAAKGCAVQPLDGGSAPESTEAQQAERERAIRDAVQTVVDTANPDDFTSNNRPRKQRIQEMVGFSVRADEVMAAYDAIMAD